jgi:hypothetical protein
MSNIIESFFSGLFFQLNSVQDWIGEYFPNGMNILLTQTCKKAVENGV